VTGAAAGAGGVSAPDAGATAAAVRRGAGLFRLPERGVIGVTGGDARRWLDGMVTNDVEAARRGPERHCHALLLTPIDRIFAELQVLARPDGFGWTWSAPRCPPSCSDWRST
jgi:folate-binding Fe-S cluster repair protein YgfZ